MGDELEVVLREWKVEISLEEAEKFKENIGAVLQKTGFSRGERYWENGGSGKLRLYSTKGSTKVGTKTLCLSLRSPTIIGGVPPMVSIIEQSIYRQKWISLNIKRDPIYA
jgi:hypothetical protein